MAIHEIFVEIFQCGPKWWTNRQADVSVLFNPLIHMVSLGFVTLGLFAHQ